MRQSVAAGTARRGGRYPFRAHRTALALVAGSGLVLLVLGVALDIGHHAGVPGLTAEALRAAGHLVTLAGMAVTTVAVALAAVLRQR